MIVLSHRGYWNLPEEKNSGAALSRSFQQGFGTETDLRDCAGNVVIAHDPPSGNELSLSRLLDIYISANRDLPLALNIKADGLQDIVGRELARYSVKNFFFFDMSIPDMIGYIRKGLPVFTRQSDVEPVPYLYEHAKGVWLDTFNDEWLSDAIVEGHLRNGKHVCVVSPELHGRTHSRFWQTLRAMDCLHDPRIMICTDLPGEAREYFQ